MKRVLVLLLLLAPSLFAEDFASVEWSVVGRVKYVSEDSSGIEIHIEKACPRERGCLVGFSFSFKRPNKEFCLPKVEQKIKASGHVEFGEDPMPWDQYRCISLEPGVKFVADTLVVGKR